MRARHFTFAAQENPIKMPDIIRARSGVPSVRKLNFPLSSHLFHALPFNARLIDSGTERTAFGVVENRSQARLHQRFTAPQRFEVTFKHHFYQLAHRHLGLPAQHIARLRRVANKHIDLGRTEKCRIDADQQAP